MDACDVIIIGTGAGRGTLARQRETKLAPEWSLERIARHAIDFWLSTEDLPRPDWRTPFARPTTCVSGSA
jgi:hypothetical protein